MFSGIFLSFGKNLTDSLWNILTTEISSVYLVIKEFLFLSIP